MATTTGHLDDPTHKAAYPNGSDHHDHATTTSSNLQNPTNANLNLNQNASNLSHEEIEQARARYNYGGNPLAHMNTGTSARFPAFGGEFQPGLYKPTTDRKFANPAPLGLSAFALTTFVLSLININVRGVSEPNIVVALAFGYGGLVQLLAGMWYVFVFSFFC